MKIVITSIQSPTPSVNRLMERLAAFPGCEIIVIGDKKGPSSYSPEASFYSFEDQMQLPYAIARLLPAGHYARKNIGYLLAIGGKAPLLYETDDDNYPGENWRAYPRILDAATVTATRGSCVNVYAYFARPSPLIWPRGLPLTDIHESGELGEIGRVASPVHQALVNNAPDVDAIWRFLNRDSYDFLPRGPVALAPHTYCPFNSQNTWWLPDSFPLLYLPSYCSFRMTDIWRSFVAERCLSEQDQNVVFHAADAVQHRNEHMIQRDFDDEVQGYTRNAGLVAMLRQLTLQTGKGPAIHAENLRTCYAALVQKGFLPPQELSLVEAWIGDVMEA